MRISATVLAMLVARGRGRPSVESRLVFLGPDRVEPLAWIELREAALASLEIGPASYPENREHHVTIELVNGNASFEKEVP